MPRSISRHRLEGEGVEQVSCPKNKVKFANGHPDTIVIHYTAGSSARGSASYLARKDVKASAHVVIGQQGEVHQLVAFDTQAWHAGRSTWAGRSGLNQYSIGIEIDNAGLLEQTADGGFVSHFGRRYAAGDVIKATHRNSNQPQYWHRYTEQQLEAVTDLCDLLIAKYGIDTIVGHEQVSPGRKIDPGPAFPLDKLSQRLLSNDRDTDEPAPEPAAPPASEPDPASSGVVTASKLNIRKGPGGSHAQTGEPLPKGTIVEIVDEHNGWLEVEVKRRGWVSGQYVFR